MSNTYGLRTFYIHTLDNEPPFIAEVEPPDYVPGDKNYGKEVCHVIEKSAYDELERKLDIATRALSEIDSRTDRTSDISLIIDKTLDEIGK